MIADGAGRAIGLRIAPGQPHELPYAVLPLVRLTSKPKSVIADRGYTSHAFRQHIWDGGARPAIPPLRREAPVAYPDWIYNNRNQVERLWVRLEGNRSVGTADGVEFTLGRDAKLRSCHRLAGAAMRLTAAGLGYLFGSLGIVTGWACSWPSFFSRWHVGQVTWGGAVIEVFVSFVPAALIGLFAVLNHRSGKRARG